MQAQKRRPQSKETQKQLNIARLDFQTMKKQKTLPQKMELKLQYLQNKIMGRSFNAKDYQELPSYQISSLQQCNSEDQIKLFISIIKCLSGKETIVYIKDQKAYIRKQETFSMWTKCYLTLDTLNFIVKKKTQKKNWFQFNLIETRPSKRYVEYKRKTAFGMIYRNQRFMIGFDQQSACERIHSLIRQLVKEKNEKKQKTQSSFKFQNNNQKNINPHFTFGLNSPQSQTSYSPSKVLEFEMIGEYVQQQKIISEKQEQKIIENQIAKQNFSSDKQFKLYSNFQHGRILISKQGFKVKMTHLFQNSYKFENILQYYMDMKNWNLQIQQCSIINKINENSYTLYFKFKKYSFMSMSRDAYAIVTANYIGQKMYLLIRNMENQSEASPYGVVRAKFNQSIELLRNHQQNQLILMTVINQINFCGYSSVSDNINMTLHLMQDFSNFHTFLLSQSISQHSTNLFNFDKKISKIQNGTFSVKKRKQSIAYSEISQRSRSQSVAQNSQQGQSQILEKQQFNFQIKKGKSKEQSNIDSFDSLFQTKNQFIKLFQVFQAQSKGSQQLVAFIQNKFYQKIYLKHRFLIDQNVQAKLYPKQYNFLIQNGKWKISENQLIFIDQQILNSQKNVIKFILKQVSSNILAGKNIMNMSLPVQIFEAKSFLEKLAEGLGFLPIFLDQASSQTNIIKQILLVSHSFSYIGAILPNIQKPFNPILGETFQCSLGGVNIYFQQISHHPPISAFYVKTQKYQAYGGYHPNVQMGLNTALAKNFQSSYVYFYDTKTKYQIRMPDYQISGLMFGDRKLKMSGKSFVFQQINGILCELSFGKDKKKIYENNKKIKPGQLVGGVYKVTNNFSQRFKDSRNFGKNFDGVKYDQIIQKFHEVKGNWYGQVFVDNILVKSIYQPVPYCLNRKIYLLPSDCSYRLDVYFKKMGNLKRSQQQKQILQNSQRKDRKLRQEFGPKVKHK